MMGAPVNTTAAVPQTHEHVACNLCGADDFDVVLEALTQEQKDAVPWEKRYAAAGDELLTDQLVRCRKCELVYVTPRPKSTFIEQGYTEADNTTYLSQGSGRLTTFEKGVKLIEKYRPNKGKILDVGCAGGFFLKAAQDAGWDAHGVEPSKHLVDSAVKMGVKAKQGVLRDRLFPEASFDVVTFWDALEHVGDPKGDLQEALRVLKPGGLLLVNYPDYSSVWAAWLKRRWWFLINVHIYYFTPKVMNKLLTAVGFTPLGHRMHFQTLDFGYLVKRLEPYSAFGSKTLAAFARMAGIEKMPFTYYASQVNVLAEKK